MRIEKTEPSTKTIVHIKCDICGAEQDERERQWILETRGGYRQSVCNVKVEREVWHYGYDGDSGGLENTTWDFCPKCFAEKVEPLLETLAKPTKREAMW